MSRLCVCVGVWQAAFFLMTASGMLVFHQVAFIMPVPPGCRGLPGREPCRFLEPPLLRQLQLTLWGGGQAASSGSSLETSVTSRAGEGVRAPGGGAACHPGLCVSPHSTAPTQLQRFFGLKPFGAAGMQATQPL